MGGGGGGGGGDVCVQEPSLKPFMHIRNNLEV